VRDDERQDVRCDDEWVVRMRLWIGFREDYYYTLLLTLLHALRMQTIAKPLGSPDPFIFYFSTKAHWC
jgi:hypothetical protein